MSTKLLLAMDIGTTNSKGALITEDGRTVASCSCRHAVSYPRPGWAEHDAEQVWWADFLKLCRQLLSCDGVDVGEIAAVGISALTPAILPMDREGNALAPAMLYGLDTRATEEIGLMNEALGEDFARRANLRPIVPKSPGPKILWIKRNAPEVFEKAAYFGGAPSYLVMKLTGKMVADYGCYKLAGLPFSLRSFGWDEQACAACGITPDRLPELKFATELAGTVTREAARVTGLPEGTAVAVGTGDYPADSLSYGTRFLGMPQISYGSCVGVNNGNDPAAILFPDYRTDWEMEAMPGGSMANGCQTIDWMISLLSGASGAGRLSDEQLEQLVSAVPAGANGLMMLPYFNGEKTPFVDPDARGVIYGLQMKHTQADLYKAALESVGYAVRHNLSLKPEVTCREAFVVGGGTRIPQLLQTVSDVTGLRQIALARYNGALYGDAFIAGMACGMFRRREEIDAWVETLPPVEPREENKAVYDRGFQTYLELYQRVKGL